MKTLNKLILEGIDGSINHKSIDQFCEEKNISFSELTNKLALLIAKKFDNGDLSFEKADKALNCIWGIIIEDISENLPVKSIPRPFFSIYEAFHEGEYDHGDIDDPDNKFTLPMIKKILKNA